MTMNWSQIFGLILFAPLIAAVVNMLLFRRKGWLAAGVSLGAAFLSMCLSLYAIFNLHESFHVSHQWLSLGQTDIRMGFFYNPMAATMLGIVTFVGFWIHVFSVGYMDDDKAKGRYFTGLSVFMFSMLGIVLADNLIMIFVFWELVGFSSYMLIAHYWHTEEAREACKKAFIMNRVGDLGLLVGIIWAYWHYGTVNLPELEQLVGEGETLVTGIALLLTCGFIGKSAQFPLHTWLPDAMAGPTPVSALIHAATMVAAGIYFLGRIAFLLDPITLDIILWLGVAMALFAGLVAFAQTDIKKILAYSTLSQLGYMAAAVGLGFPGLALFHTATHAFFKALLFLGSGSVIHACHHEQDIFRMGGLARKMPVTAITFAIGTLALAGVTFTSGYFSKDAIIEAAFLDRTAAFVLLMLGALLTAAYMGRLYFIAFLGQPKSDNSKHAHESSPWMTFPLIILAVFAVIAGYEWAWPEALTTLYTGELHAVHEAIKEAGAKTGFLIVGLIAWLGGFTWAYFYYGAGAKEDQLHKRAPIVYHLLSKRLWFDECYSFYVKRIQQPISEVLNFIDVVIIGGLFVRGCAGLAGLLGIGAKILHTGNIHAYVYWFLFGVLVYGGYALGFL